VSSGDLKHRVLEIVDELGDELLQLSRALHANPELAFEERAACALLVDAVRGAGLEVETPAHGLETAFRSDFGGGEGACVALLAEYDALPEIGHACGHNLIATASVGAGLALARLAEELPGRVRLLGTPAEERGGGKELMARAGALDGVDAALMMHPASANLETMPSLCVAELEVRYAGRAAHASATPEQGINALDAMVIAYAAVAALRQHIRQTERIHGIITEGGLAPNIVPERSVGRFYVRAADSSALAVLKERVEGCFRAGAEATGATLELEWPAVEYLDLRFNAPLAAAFRRNAESLGREFTPLDEIPSSFRGSTDMGNVSHRVPSIHPMLAAAPPGVVIHHADFAKWAGSEMGDAAALDGARALAMTALDFLSQEELRRDARRSFEEAEP